jgi:hypothetical protein
VTLCGRKDIVRRWERNACRRSLLGEEALDVLDDEHQMTSYTEEEVVDSKSVDGYQRRTDLDESEQ